MIKNYFEKINNNDYISIVDNKEIVISENKEYLIFANLDKSASYEIKVLDNVEAKVIEIINLENEINVFKQVKCGKNSKLDIVTLEYTVNGKKNVEVKTYLDEAAYINNKKIIIFNSEYSGLADSYLDTPNSTIETTNVLINSSGKVCDIYENVHHHNIDTTSLLFNYGICKNNSTININTNGLIIKDAKRSNIRQKSKGILLDLESSISANPWLQIDEYDVIANHGAGVGAIDEEDLYYLMSRGLTKQDSEKLIIGGFVEPIYSSLPEGELRELVIKVVNKYL